MSAGRLGGRNISIHALREEGDAGGQLGKVSTQTFLSTPSARRATDRDRISLTEAKISIHALREEGDFLTPAPMPRRPNFYPRPPRGGRPAASGSPRSSLRHFYPRPPRGGRRCAAAEAWRLTAISIHALREEGDDMQDTWTDTISISIHALREEGDGLPSS